MAFVHREHQRSLLSRRLAVDARSHKLTFGLRWQLDSVAEKELDGFEIIGAARLVQRRPSALILVVDICSELEEEGQDLVGEVELGRGLLLVGPTGHVVLADLAGVDERALLESIGDREVDGEGRHFVGTLKNLLDALQTLRRLRI